MPVAAAPATAAPVVQIPGWKVTLVNAERRRVDDGGTLPLCQAIPPTMLAMRVRYRDAEPATRLRMRVRVPGHRTRTRALRLDHASGRAEPAFTPSGLNLRDAAFPAGRYVVRVTLGDRRLARATLHLDGGGTTC